jgi:hypothetical protein
MGATAYIDESLRAGVGLYVIGAVIVSPRNEEPVRKALVMRFRQGGRLVHFHWRNEAGGRREEMARVLVDLDLELHAYVCAGVPKRQMPRARALCLEALVWDQRSQDTTRLLLETREEHNDRVDRRTIAGAKSGRRASAALSYDFGHRDTEPLLWLPDALAGIVASARLEGSPSDHLETLGGALAIHEVRYR